MFLFIEPISKNTGMFVPAYPLPILEIASFVRKNIPRVDLSIISMAIDYGLPVNANGKQGIYEELIKDIKQVNPKAIGISCTAISQADEVLQLSALIKKNSPDTFIFLGGYFPTIYYKEIFSRTSDVDMIIVGEGEVSSLKIIEKINKGESPYDQCIPNAVWKKNDRLFFTDIGVRFDLNAKAHLDLDLLKYPAAYDILPYSFSRGCPYRCNFCMEDYIRPVRKEVPFSLIQTDLENILSKSSARTLLVSDALFRSFHIIPFLRSRGIKINFETRCDVLDPSIIPSIADVCGMLILGFESASYDTLRRMNKIKDRSHYERYLSNTIAICEEASRCDVPLTMFIIVGYPGDREEDLTSTLEFVGRISKNNGSGGQMFKAGECQVYPNTKIHKLALSLPDVIFDDDGVFGQNTVRRSSKDLGFDLIKKYSREIYGMSNITLKLQGALSNMIPFFRLPVRALEDEMVPDSCFKDSNRNVFRVHGDSLLTFNEIAPSLREKYKEWMSGERSTRILPL